MSLYAVHSICRRVRKDESFREELRRDPETALAGFALSDAERAALLAGDVAALERLGAHGYLLGSLARFELFGLDRKSYVSKMKR